jgi:hypothetical protein
MTTTAGTPPLMRKASQAATSQHGRSQRPRPPPTTTALQPMDVADRRTPLLPSNGHPHHKHTEDVHPAVLATGSGRGQHGSVASRRHRHQRRLHRRRGPPGLGRPRPSWALRGGGRGPATAFIGPSRTSGGALGRQHDGVAMKTGQRRLGLPLRSPARGWRVGLVCQTTTSLTTPSKVQYTTYQVVQNNKMI